jgi:hypothetical protein
MNGRILHVEGVFSRFNMEYLVSFVYALNDGSLKKELWEYLLISKAALESHGVLQVTSMKLFPHQTEKEALESLLP